VGFVHLPPFQAKAAHGPKTVIPAKTGTQGEHMDVLGFEERGIHFALMQKPKMDSHFRGNDGKETWRHGRRTGIKPTAAPPAAS
jgi:hypothetical protein